jgi:hypothetical protein
VIEDLDVGLAVEASEVKAGDRVRFPDGRGGHTWASVTRRILNTDSAEIMFADGFDVAYKTLGLSEIVFRALREGE